MTESIINDVQQGEWKEHPRFKGILIKPLISKQENNLANVNAVRVPHGCEISSHSHAEQVETIYVISGQSIMNINGKDHTFKMGQIIAVPSQVEHSLRNEGTEEVYLLTVFTPPL